MKTVGKLLVAGAVFALAKGLDNRLEVTHYQIKSKKLPKSFENFRIVHIADFHCDKTAGVSDAIRNEKPDIICVTGDMAHDDGSFYPFIELLKKLSKIAPVYLVSGNHDVWRSDYEEFIVECKKCGAVFLQDERVLLEKDGEQISISGIEDPFSVTYNEIHKNLDKSIEKLGKSDLYDILLFHRANLLDKFSDCGVDLILSGHMHGGQIRIPGIGGMVCPKTNFHDKTKILFPKYFGGEYEIGKTKMIVTRGLGNPTIFPRLYNRPEICTVILKRD